jgi:two-component system cell cycle sensor histidine kinase/response regulator CckA
MNLENYRGDSYLSMQFPIAIAMLPPARLRLFFTLMGKSLDTTIEEPKSEPEDRSGQSIGPLRWLSQGERYRWLFDSLGEAAGLVDKDERFTLTNPAAEEIFGVPPSTLVGRSLLDFLPPEAREVVRSQTERRRENKRDTYEHEIIRSDGTSRTVLVTVTPIYGENGLYEGALGVFRDITEQKRLEDERRKSDERWKLLFDFAPDAYYLSDLKGTFIAGNRAAEELVGYGKEELIGKSFLNLKLLPLDQIPKAAALLAKNAMGFSTRNDEFVLNRKDGGQVQVEISTFPLELDGRTVVLGIARNVTDRNKDKKALQESERDKQIILDSLSEGISYHDTQLRIKWANQVQVASSGFTAEQAVGHYCYKLVFGLDTPCKGCIVLKVLKSGKIESGEIVTPANKNMWVTAYPVRGDRGEIIGVVETTQDVTEQRNIEDQLRQSQKMEAIGHLAGGVAHDMNNILAAIMGSASALGMELAGSGDASDDIENILEACRKGAQLTQNLLGFARKGKYIRENISLNEAVKRVNQLLKHNLSKKIIFKTDLDMELDLIEGDLNQIENALMNLCINALDAMEDRGEIAILTRNTIIEGSPRKTFGDLPPGRYVKLQVKDTGLGMDFETKARAFDPFFTTKPQGEGTGLGLSMVWGVVKNHGGVVTIDSRLGSGTTMTIFLPAARQVKTLQDEEKFAGVASAVPGRGGILLVDDEEVIQNTVQRMLEKLGCWVFLAKNGQEALQVFEEKRDRIDLVFLDMIMPVMDGSETFNELRKLDPNVKILLSSGFTKDAMVDNLLGHGAWGFIAKPFDIDQLDAELKRILEPDRAYVV